MKSIPRTTFFLCLALVSAQSAGQSFRCADATTRVERAICADAELSLLDAELAESFESATRVSPDRGASLRREQRQWLTERNRTCGAIEMPSAIVACLTDSYSKRNAELDAITRPAPDDDPLTDDAAGSRICDATAARLAAAPRKRDASSISQLIQGTRQGTGIEKLAGLRAWAAGHNPPLSVSDEMASRFENSGSVYGTWTLTQLPGKNFYALHSVEGTMHCYNSLYFAIHDGRLTLMDAPRGIEREDGGCMVSREFAVIDQTPVMLEELFTYGPGMTSWLTIASWEQERFAHACRITFQYEPALDAAILEASSSCTSEQCSRWQNVATTMTADVQRSPRSALDSWSKALADPMRERLHVASPRIGAIGIQSYQEDPAQLTKEAPIRLPYAEAERLYVVSIGHETIGWRSFAEWKVVFHEVTSDQLIERASFSVGMSKGPIKSFEVTRR